MLGVPYIGSGPQAQAIALDKVMTKIILQRHDLPTPKYQVFSDHNEQIKEIDFPAIVKPKMEAVSLGLKVVHNEKDLPDAVKEIIEIYKQPTLVESFITGREFAIGLLGNGAQLEIFPIVEIDFKGNYESIQTHDDKKNNPYDKICPPNISDDVTEEIGLLAYKAFNVIDIYDFGRVDMRMDNKGNLYYIYLN